SLREVSAGDDSWTCSQAWSALDCSEVSLEASVMATERTIYGHRESIFEYFYQQRIQPDSTLSPKPARLALGERKTQQPSDEGPPCLSRIPDHLLELPLCSFN